MKKLSWLTIALMISISAAASYAAVFEDDFSGSLTDKWDVLYQLTDPPYDYNEYFAGESYCLYNTSNSELEVNINKESYHAPNQVLTISTKDQFTERSFNLSADAYLAYGSDGSGNPVNTQVQFTIFSDNTIGSSGLANTGYQITWMLYNTYSNIAITNLSTGTSLWNSNSSAFYADQWYTFMLDVTETESELILDFAGAQQGGITRITQTLNIPTTDAEYISGGAGLMMSVNHTGNYTAQDAKFDNILVNVPEPFTCSVLLAGSAFCVIRRRK